MNPKKLLLHFSDFSVILYAIYKNQENCNTIGDILLQGGPRKETFLCNVAPGRGQRWSDGDSGRGSPDFGRGRVGKCSMGL
jgi:hypothetical protein